MLSSADLHVGDLDLGEVLPVPTVAAIPGAARKPENPDLLVLAVPHDLGGDPGALHVRRPALDLLAVARDERSEEHTSELQSRPHLVCRPLLYKTNRVVQRLESYLIRHHRAHWS